MNDERIRFSRSACSQPIPCKFCYSLHRCLFLRLYALLSCFALAVSCLSTSTKRSRFCISKCTTGSINSQLDYTQKQVIPKGFVNRVNRIFATLTQLDSGIYICHKMESERMIGIEDEESGVRRSQRLKTQLTCYVFPALLMLFVFFVVYLILRKPA